MSGSSVQNLPSDAAPAAAKDSGGGETAESKAPGPKRTLLKYTGLLLVVAFASYELIPLAQNVNVGKLSVDEQVYHQIAQSVVEGKGFNIDEANKGEVQAIYWTRRDGPTTHAAPGHILYIAALYALGSDEAGVSMANAILYIISAALLYLILFEVAGVAVALIAAFLFLNHGVLIHYAIRLPLMTEMPYVFLTLLTLFVATRQTRYKIPHGVLVGALTGYLILTRGEGVLFAPLIGLYLGKYTIFSKKTFWKPWKDLRLVAFVLLCAVVVAPWVIRNYALTGEFVLSRNGAGNQLFSGNNPNSPDTDSLAQNVAVNSHPWPDFVYTDLNEVQVDKAIAAEAKAWILDNPLVYLNVCVRRFLYLWQPMDSLQLVDNAFVRIGLWMLFCFGLFFYPWRDPKALLLVSFILVYTFLGTMLMGGNMTARLRAMMSPAEMAVVAVGMTVLVTMPVMLFRQRRLAPRYNYGLIALAGAAALLALIVSIGLTAGRSGSVVMKERFDDSDVRFVPIDGSFPGPRLQIVDENGDGVLKIVKKARPEGTLHLLQPELYEPGRDYRVTMNVEFQGEKAGITARALVFDDMQALQGPARTEYYQRRNSPYKTLGEVNARADDGGNHQFVEMYFAAPYRAEKPIVLWISATGFGETVLVDDLMVRESNLVERYTREYFTAETYRRRAAGFYQ